MSSCSGRYNTDNSDMLMDFVQIIRGHVALSNAGVINGICGRFAGIFQHVTFRLIKTLRMISKEIKMIDVDSLIFVSIKR